MSNYSGIWCLWQRIHSSSW